MCIQRGPRRCGFSSSTCDVVRADARYLSYLHRGVLKRPRRSVFSASFAVLSATSDLRTAGAAQSSSLLSTARSWNLRADKFVGQATLGSFVKVMSEASRGSFAQPTRTYEPRATNASWFGIVGVLLMFPFGFLLGPAALWSGISGLRRIRRSGGALAGSKQAIAGIAMGSIICSMCAVVLILEIVVVLLTGAPIPAP